MAYTLMCYPGADKQVLVKGWLEVGEACFSPNSTRLRQQILSKQQEPNSGNWTVWSVLSPYRPFGIPSDSLSKNSFGRSSGDFCASYYSRYLAVLRHYLVYHLRLGLAGSVHYAPPSLMQCLERDEGHLKDWTLQDRFFPIAWDKFGTHQQNVVPKGLTNPKKASA